MSALATPSATTDEVIPSRALVCRARDGDELAFASLVERYSQRLWRFLVARGHSQSDADDLVQETFIRAYRALPRYNERYAVSTWLFTIATRLGINRFRDRKPSSDLAGADAVAAPGSAPDDHIAVDELWQRAQAVLPARWFQGLWLRYGEHLSLTETAAELGVSDANAKVMLHRARKRLASHLEETA